MAVASSQAWIAYDALSWLPGDGVGLLGALLALHGPFVLSACIAVGWPRAGGAVAGTWIMAWGLWWAEPHLLAEALWLLLLLPFGLAWLGWRRPGLFPPLAFVSVIAGAFGGPRPALGEPPTCEGEGGPDLLLITLDTVRADHLGSIGGARFLPATPHLDALAGRGALFTEGVAPAPLTGPSHVAMLTGRDPLEIGVVRNGVPLSGVETLAEQLCGRGYRTGAFVGATVLDRRMGLDRGFQHYDDRFGGWHRLQGTWPRRLLSRLDRVPPQLQRDGADVVARAVRWRNEGEGPTFLWVHLYDAHHPYDPPAAELEAVVDADPGGAGSVDDVMAWSAWANEHHRVKDLGALRPRAEQDAPMRAYAGEVAEVDGLVGQLVEAWPAAAVVVAADHGESLVEHGYFFNHGAHVYQPSLRVPLIAVGPGFAPGTRSDRPTPVSRVHGTLLRWAGASAEGLEVPYLHAVESLSVGQEARGRMRLARLGPELAVRQGTTKWLTRRAGTWRFDLVEDPGERRPEAVDRPDLEERLGELVDGARPVIEGLEALGYVH